MVPVILSLKSSMLIILPIHPGNGLSKFCLSVLKLAHLIPGRLDLKKRHKSAKLHHPQLFLRFSTCNQLTIVYNDKVFPWELAPSGYKKQISRLRSGRLRGKRYTRLLTWAFILSLLQEGSSHQWFKSR